MVRQIKTWKSGASSKITLLPQNLVGPREGNPIGQKARLSDNNG